jgi:hypothetical protein
MEAHGQEKKVLDAPSLAHSFLQVEMVYFCTFISAKHDKKFDRNTDLLLQVKWSRASNQSSHHFQI